MIRTTSMTDAEMREFVANERRAAAEAMRNYIASQIRATVENAEGDYKAGAMAAHRVCINSVYTEAR
jgi:hypothetical protein